MSETDDTAKDEQSEPLFQEHETPPAQPNIEEPPSPAADAPEASGSDDAAPDGNPYRSPEQSGIDQAAGHVKEAARAISGDDQTMGMLAHLLGIFTGFIGPLIIYLMKKDESPWVGERRRMPSSMKARTRERSALSAAQTSGRSTRSWTCSARAYCVVSRPPMTMA